MYSSLFTSLFTSDVLMVANVTQQLALVIGVALIAYLAIQKKSLVPTKFKAIILIIVGVWAIATLSQVAFSAYNYVDEFRPLKKQSDLQEQGLN